MKKYLWCALAAFAVVALAVTSGTIMADESVNVLPVFVDQQFDDLIHAVFHNDRDEARGLLQAGVNPNRLDERGMAPLHYALLPRPDDPDTYGVVAVLLDYGADPTLENGKGFTPLLLAALNRRVSQAVVERLIEAGADPNQVTQKGGMAILTMARMTGNDAAAAAISDAGGVIGSSPVENRLGGNIDKLGAFNKELRKLSTRRRANPPSDQEWEQLIVDAAQAHLGVPDGEPALDAFRERVRARIQEQEGCGSCDTNK